MVKFVLHPKAFCADQNQTHRMEGIAWSVKHLPCKHNDLSSTPATPAIPGKSQSVVVSAEKGEAGRSLGLTRQAGQISESLPSERTLSQSIEVDVS